MSKKASEQIYTQESHPELYERYGEAFVEGSINPFVCKVAKRVALMPQGKDCEYVEISNQTSRDEMIAFADFHDGVRIWVKSTDMDKPAFSRWDKADAAVLNFE